MGGLSLLLKDLKATLDEGELTALLDHCARMSNYKLAVTIWEFLEKFNVEKKPWHYASMIITAARAKRRKKMFQLLSELSTVDVDHEATSNVLPICAAACTPTREAFKMVKTMISDGVLPHPTPALNAILAATNITSEVTAANKIFSHMIANEIQPDMETLNNIISLYGRNNRVSDAIQIFDAISQTMEPDLSVCKHLLKACIYSNQADTASALLEQWIEQGKTLSRDFFKIVIEVRERACITYSQLIMVW